MKILGLLARKGGAGKSTLAIHLAVLAAATHRTLVVDTDPQGSLKAWFRRRREGAPPSRRTNNLVIANVDIEQLPELLKAARAKNEIDLVVIDTRPSVDRDTQLVAQHADVCLVPIRPRIFDLDAVEQTAQMLLKERTPAFFVLNGVQAKRGVGEASVTVDARHALRHYQLPISPVAIGERVALHYALTNGRAVTEFDPKCAAAREMRRLWTWTEQTAWPHAPSSPKTSAQPIPLS